MESGCLIFERKRSFHETTHSKHAQRLNLTGATKPKRQKDKTKANLGVVVEGMDDLMLRMSKCCNPVPGDEIIGYITKGRGTQ